MSFKVLLTYFDHPPYTRGDIERKILGKVGAEVVGPVHCRTEEELITAAKDADAILLDQAPLTSKVLRALDRVCVVVNCSIGVDNIDLRAATEKGVLVANVPDYCIKEVAEHTIALLLALWRKIVPTAYAMKSGTYQFETIRPIERLAGKKGGIVGFGRIGRSVADRLKGFEVDILAHDPLLPADIFAAAGVTSVEFDDLLKMSDIVLIHSALTSENFHMIDEGQLRLMKKTAVIVNAARGPLINEKALLRALTEDWIRGAALDVLESDLQDRDNPLVKLDNVLLTPHLGWYSEDALRELQVRSAEEAARVLQGALPKNLVNEEILS